MQVLGVHTLKDNTERQRMHELGVQTLKKKKRWWWCCGGGDDVVTWYVIYLSGAQCQGHVN